jgi:hypothetical protein
MTARKSPKTEPSTMFAVVNSVPGSNYTQFQIKTWDPDTRKSVLYAEGYTTRLSAKRDVDSDPKLTRVNSFREAAGYATGVAVPPKPGHAGRKHVEDDTFNGALAASLENVVSDAA